MKIVTSEEMKTLDRRATEDFGVPSLLLMENAGRGLVDEIEATLGPVAGKQVAILAGRGKNGGDGLVAARHLRMRGAEVFVYLLSPIEKVSGDAQISLKIWIQSGGKLRAFGSFKWPQMAESLSKSDFIIDALLGTGLSRPVEGNYAKAIAFINRAGRPVAAVDIPSGVSADTGAVLGVAVKADYTFTMALPKRGHFQGEGLELRGGLKVIDIGFPPALIERADVSVDLIAPSIFSGLLAPRPKGIHKGRLGHLLVIAGSTGKRGAAYMTSLAALRAGAGLVTLALPRSLDASAAPMEIMTLPLPETNEGSLSLGAEKFLLQAVEGKSAVALGPGLSQNLETQKLIRNLVEKIPLPMVIDADGINALAGDLTILKKKKEPIILTPHPGEMGRLLGKRADFVQQDRFGIAVSFAQKWGVLLVLKGAYTIIAFPDGRLSVNDTGNPGMATAGIGDALTGAVASLIAQGKPLKEAVLMGVHLHGLAGDLAAAPSGGAGLITSDLIGKIPEAIRALANKIPGMEGTS
ncbi:MAG TPA: NAD(P)H-hydrate dehydratase [Candidatus Manganitrophaceae bacterium]|nr:NAD(P)H-hydrate dehydratase [Candidatus Manganitrophaceae bacterium]